MDKIAMKILLVAALAVFALPLFAGDWGVLDENAVGRQNVYVSSSSGNDNNDGSKQSPLKTFSKIPRKNANIFLKRGDVFYSPLRDLENCVVDAYGDGEKPVLCGFKKLSDASAWEKLPNNVWRLDMHAFGNFDGFVRPEHDDWTFNNIGSIYDAQNDVVHGRLLRFRKDLKNDWDFQMSDVYSRRDVAEDTYRWLYVKLPHNPSEGAKLCFSPYLNGMQALTRCTIRNIVVKGFGRHGICQAVNTKIQNVDIDVIGGGVQVGYPHNWIRLGNGVEFWISDKNKGAGHDNLVENCRISRTYDCGSTIQGIGLKLVDAVSIKFRRNIYIHCRQAFEHFLNSKNSRPKYVDCEFSENVCFEMGDNGFSSPEARDANFLSYEKKDFKGERENVGIKIAENICYGGSIYFGNAWAIMESNTFYVYKDEKYLLQTYGRKSFKIAAESDDNITEYRHISGDSDSKIILVDRSDSNVRTDFLKKYIPDILKK